MSVQSEKEKVIFNSLPEESLGRGNKQACLNQIVVMVIVIAIMLTGDNSK